MISTRSALFGEAFSREITVYKSFIVMYQGNIPLIAENEIVQQGFLKRKMGRTFHASLVVKASCFYQETTFHWAAHIARLIMFSKIIRGMYHNTHLARSIQ